MRVCVCVSAWRLKTCSRAFLHRRVESGLYFTSWASLPSLPILTSDPLSAPDRIFALFRGHSLYSGSDMMKIPVDQQQFMKLSLGSTLLAVLMPLSATAARLNSRSCCRAIGYLS